ncbi:hypothetical protein [Pelosinus sp. UFO1]|uniref:hypothetical protein n=1 Tax=Pelosinus sp. UFO1 TaxID=484770 RepID=UPI00068ACEB8|nr:hypothetical protein [Pelosinus sp. UFO1]
MGNQEIIERIKNEFANFKASGNMSVSVDSVLTYLDVLEKDISHNVQDKETQRFLTQLAHERKIELCKVDNQVRIANVDRLEECQRLMLKSAIEIGQNALKYVMLINGGAGVAMLAFAGNILSKGSAINCFLIWSLTSFAVGVLAAAVSSGAGYFSQCYYSCSYEKQKNKLVDIINTGKNDGKATSDFDSGSDEKNGNWWRNAAIGAAVLGYVLFLFGVITAYNGLKI